MGFFRNIYLMFQKVFGLSLAKRSEFCDSDVRDIPAFVPPAPVPIGSGGVQHFKKPKRQKDALSRLKCTQGKETIVIECNRPDYRQVTRAIHRDCGVKKRGITHLRQVRTRSVLVHQREMGIVENAFGGASYHELRAA